MSALLLGENLLPPIADIVEEYDETALRINGESRITFSVEKEVRLYSPPVKDGCSYIDVPLLKGVYKLIYGPPTYLFGDTLTPLIFYHNGVNLDTLPAISLFWKSGGARSITLRGKTSFSHIIFSDVKSGDVRSIPFKHDMVLNTNHDLIDIWSSDTFIVLLLSIGPRTKEISAVISSREFMRKKLINEMKDFIKKSIPEAKNIRGSPLGATVEFKLDYEEAQKYGFPARHKIKFAPLGLPSKSYFTYKDRKIFKGTPLGKEIITWFERMYNMREFPEKDEELMRVYRRDLDK